MRLLITGSSGYIGSALVSALRDDGHDIIGCDVRHSVSSARPNFYNPNRYQLAVQSVQRHGVEAVIHLAGHSSVPQCIQDPDGAIENNVTGFAQVLSHCKGVKLIYASSSAVYNGCKRDAADETWTNFRPTNRLDTTKYIIDLLAQTSTVEYYGLRFGTVNGASPNTRWDLMINHMVKDAKNKGCVTVINPQVNRAILDISDLVGSVRSILGRQEDNRGIYNVGSFNSTVSQIAEAVGQLLGVPAVIDETPSPSYDFSMSSSLFERTFGYAFQGNIASIVRGLV